MQVYPRLCRDPQPRDRPRPQGAQQGARRSAQEKNFLFVTPSDGGSGDCEPDAGEALDGLQQVEPRDAPQPRDQVREPGPVELRGPQGLVFRVGPRRRGGGRKAPPLPEAGDALLRCGDVDVDSLLPSLYFLLSLD